MHKPQFDGTPTTEEYRAYLALLLRDTFIGRAENLPLARATDRILAQDVLARLDRQQQRHPKSVHHVRRW